MEKCDNCYCFGPAVDTCPIHGKREEPKPEPEDKADERLPIEKLFADLKIRISKHVGGPVDSWHGKTKASQQD